MQETVQVGSLRIQVDADDQVRLVRYDGQEWRVVSNSNDPVVQQEIRQAVAGQKPGLYVPPMTIGTIVRI